MRAIIMTCCLFFALQGYAQSDSSNAALLIIDIQQFYFPGGKWELVDPLPAAEKAKQLLDHFRASEQTIIHVRHNTQPGMEFYPLVEPLLNEKIITKNEVNAFLGTDLLDYLRERHITDLVLCGMQTHMCLEAATRAAADYGFRCTVIADACATRDLSYGGRTIPAIDVQAAVLAALQSYARVTDTKSWFGEGK